MTHRGVELIRSFLAESGVATGSIVEQRRAMAEIAASSPPPGGITVEPAVFGGRSAEWLEPGAGDRSGVVLYLHGGGYCTGSLDSHRALAGRIALAAGCPVATLDYRLAPGHPFPAALSDATAAYRDLLGRGIEPGCIAVAGDSAGGGLALAAPLRSSGRTVYAVVAIPPSTGMIAPVR